MENYEQKYKEAFERAKSLIDFCSDSELKTLEHVFPELKESEDEKIRKALIFHYQGDGCLCTNEYRIDYKDICAWLKKQGERKEATCVADIIDRLSDKEQDILFKELEIQKEQKSAEKVKSKFKVGDWVIDKSFGSIKQIKHFDNDEKVWFTDGTGTFIEFLEGYRLWTIKDAKPGDVLHATGWHSDCIFIFSGLDNWKFDEPDGEKALATSYCCIHVYSDMIEFGTQGPDCIEVNTVKPATKIQCDLLFRNIRENGYEWDANALFHVKLSM